MGKPTEEQGPALVATAEVHAVVLLGLLVHVSTPTEIARRAKIHIAQLKQIL